MPDITRVLVAAEFIEAADISEALGDDPGVDVVQVVNDYDKIIEAVLDAKPSVIVIDFESSPSKTLDAINRVTVEMPKPIVVLLSSKVGEKKISDIILAGALSVVEKPCALNGKAHQEASLELIESVKICSKIKIRRVADRGKAARETEAVKPERSKIVAIASSTGGPRALKEVLSKLPADFPGAVLIAQHIARGFTRGLVEWLNEECALPVRVPVDGERVTRGVIFVAPEDCHMTVVTGSRIRLETSEPVDGHRPSANILLSSVAKVCGSRAIGVVLTGMGKDGAKGLQAIKEAGGKTIAQDEESSAVYGMPQVAARSGAADRILPLNRIAEEIFALVRSQK